MAVGIIFYRFFLVRLIVWLVHAVIFAIFSSAMLAAMACIFFLVFSIPGTALGIFFQLSVLSGLTFFVLKIFSSRFSTSYFLTAQFFAALALLTPELKFLLVTWIAFQFLGLVFWYTIAQMFETEQKIIFALTLGLKFWHALWIFNLEFSTGSTLIFFMVYGTAFFLRSASDCCDFFMLQSLLSGGFLACDFGLSSLLIFFTLVSATAVCFFGFDRQLTSASLKFLLGFGFLFGTASLATLWVKIFCLVLTPAVTVLSSSYIFTAAKLATLLFSDLFFSTSTFFWLLIFLDMFRSDYRSLILAVDFSHSYPRWYSVRCVDV